MLRYGVDDLRLFFENDLRFLRQFFLNDAILPSAGCVPLSIPPLGSDELARLLTMSGVEVETCAPVAPAVLRGGRGPGCARCRTPRRRPADRVHCGCGKKASCSPWCAGRQRHRGHESSLCAGRGHAARGTRNQGGFDARRREPRHAVLGARARPVGRPQRAARASADATLGRDVREVLALDDRIFTLKLTPNRADCLSVLGVAREVSALPGRRSSRPRSGPCRRPATRNSP